MNLKAELSKLRQQVAEKAALAPGGYWNWTPCPHGSNLGFYERKGECRLELPKGGKAVKLQFADIENASDRAGDYAEGELVYPTEADVEYFAENVPLQIIESLGKSRDELRDTLLSTMDVLTSEESSDDLLARMVPQWADLEEREKAMLSRELDSKRGIKWTPSEPLRPESESIVKDTTTFLERAVPSAIEMVKEVISKREKPEKYEGIPDYIVQSPDRLEVYLRSKRKAERIKRNNERDAEKNPAAKAFESDRGWIIGR